MPHPFVDHVGAKIVERKNGTSLLGLTIEPHHFNSHGVVHGAVLFTLADTGMGAALYSDLSAEEQCATIEIKINYFRPVLEGEIECRSQVIHKGRTVANVESTLIVGGSMVGKANGTFAIYPRKGKSAA